MGMACMAGMACQNDINSTSQNIMQLSKYCSTWLGILCNFQNMVQLLEICHTTQEGCIFLGNVYNDLRKVMGVEGTDISTCPLAIK